MSMPFKRYEDMGFIQHSKYLGIIQLNRQIVKNLSEKDKKDLIAYCDKALERYFKNGMNA